MKTPMDHVTDAELTVMKALWERGTSTIRELTSDLYPGGGASHYATVQKLLDRLEAKSCVRHRPRGRVNVYTASRARQDLIAHRLRETADKLCEGSLTPLLTQLVGSARLSKDQLAELRKLVDRMERSRED